ncbi:hypothetical protein ACI65C_005451 [Semiaphis heraclei]
MACFHICLLVLCLVGLSCAQKYDPYWDDKNYYCGSSLTDEMQIVCKGRYNELPVDQVLLSIEIRRTLGLPLIVDECCDEPCSRKTLAMYCAPDAL